MSNILQRWLSEVGVHTKGDRFEQVIYPLFREKLVFYQLPFGNLCAWACERSILEMQPISRAVCVFLVPHTIEA